MKPTIRKAGDRWVLTRPAFGFARSDEVTVHESWKAAVAALQSAPASGSPPQLGHYSLVQFNARGGWRGTIRMEDR